MSLVNWSRPIQLYHTKEKLHFVGWSCDDRTALVETTYSSVVYRANKNSGHIVGVGHVCNIKEPWEKAFEQYKLEEPDDGTEEYIFKRGFEFGRNCK
jgi:hypothetical protein